MKKYLQLTLVALALGLAGCATTPKGPQMSQLQLRQLQTRSFENANTMVVMKAMVNVLQDDDFIIKNTSDTLGLLNATKEVDIESKTDAFFGKLANALNGNKNEAWNKSQIIEASANITTVGDASRVRMNFQRKTLNTQGHVVSVESITDEAYYQNFFSKVSKSIYLEEEQI